MRLLRWILFSTITLTFLGEAFAEPWIIHTQNLRSYRRKIENGEKKLNELIAQKAILEDAKEINKILADMVTTHGEIQDVIKRHRDELNHMRFRHPEKGQEIEQRYKREYKTFSLDEYQEGIGINAKLDRLKEKIHLHYGKTAEDKEKLKRQPQKRGIAEEESKRIKLIK